MYVLTPSLIVSPTAIAAPHLPVVGWQNKATGVTASSAAAAHPAAELVNPFTHLYWQSESTATQYLTLSLPAGSIDYIGIARHNFGSAGITVSIEADMGSGWATVFPGYLPADDKPLLLRFETVDMPVGVRVKLVPAGIAPSAAVLYAGELLTLEQGVQAPHTPLPYGRARNITTGRSESGEYLGRIESGAQRRSKADIRNLTPAFYRGHVDPFLVNGGPFFFVWAPQEYPDEVGYAWCTNDPVPVPELDGRIGITLELEAIAP